jgi:inner membrane protein
MLASVLARSHILIADAAWLALRFGPPTAVRAPLLGLGDARATMATLAVITFAALLPDLDHPRALLAQWRLAKHGPLSLVRPLAIPAFLLHAEFGHRGGMHSLLAVIGVYLGGGWIGAQVGLPALGAVVAWGYLLHIAADMLTHHGVPLLWPLTRDRFGLPRPLDIRTGGIGESVYLAVLMLASALYATSARL